jgi:hypothetical protein
MSQAEFRDEDDYEAADELSPALLAYERAASEIRRIDWLEWLLDNETAVVTPL